MIENTNFLCNVNITKQNKTGALCFVHHSCTGQGAIEVKINPLAKGVVAPIADLD